MSEIATYTKKMFDPVHPDIQKIDVVDIAHSLSLLCRANGHFPTFYSVGQHCLNCAQEAIARGFDSLGFSMHSYVPCSGIGSLAAIRDYQEEILRLKKAYEGRLKIYLGIEYDIDSVHGPEGFAYTIASVHCLKRNGVCFDFDRKLEQTRELIDQYFDGDGMAFAKCYYERVSQIPQYGSFDVLGHFDLVAKNNEQGKFFDTQSAQYLQYAVDTIHALQGKIPLFEVNTGCIARAAAKSPPNPACSAEFPLLPPHRQK